MRKLSLAAAFAQWNESVRPSIPENDRPALAESWHIYTDGLAKNGQLGALQYHYAPSFDDPMPGSGSKHDPLADDRAFILQELGITLAAVFVPFSQSRNREEKNLSLNWRVTLKYGTRDVLTEDYSQGIGYAPAYSLSVKDAGGRDSIMRHGMLKREAETGTHYRHHGRGAPLPPPAVADVLYSLLMDASAIDAGGFEHWCDELGYSSDSIRARAMYDACIETAVKLRGAFGESKLAELRELFEDF